VTKGQNVGRMFIAQNAVENFVEMLYNGFEGII